MIAMLRIPVTLSRYIARIFIQWFSAVFCGFLAILILFDTIELLRRAEAKEDATIALMLKLALLRLPYLSVETITFAVLFSAMLAFWRLTRTNELIVARAAGVSVWQLLAPVLACAAVVGLLKILVISPLASITYAEGEAIEASALSSGGGQFTVSEGGLWLREPRETGSDILHARVVEPISQALEDVTIFRLGEDDRFLSRLDAHRGRLDDGSWLLQDVHTTDPSAQQEILPEVRIPTSLTWKKIEDSFATPESMPVWELPQFIRVLEATGFSAVRHRLHLHEELATPLLLCAMILIAAAFSLRRERTGTRGVLVISGVLAGFSLYVVSDLVNALGMSGRLPPELAAWTPAGVAALLGTALLFHLEDG